MVARDIAIGRRLSTQDNKTQTGRQNHQELGTERQSGFWMKRHWVVFIRYMSASYACEEYSIWDVWAQLGLKAQAWARLGRARALDSPGPSPSPGAGSEALSLGSSPGFFIDKKKHYARLCMRNMCRNYGKHHLKNAMKESKDRRGIGVLRCLPFMEQCYSAGSIAFDTKGTKHLRKYVEVGSEENGTFRTELTQIGRLLNPIARALKTLEGQQVTCSDVFFIYIGLAVAFQRAFSDPTETFAAFDRRFNIFMNDCTPGMFLLSYFLDPILAENSVQVYYSDMALKLNLPPRSTFSKETAPQMARDLIRYARRMLANEQLREQEGGPEEGEVLVKQLIAYMYREAPFNDPCTKPLFRLSWWQARINNSDANQIAKMAAWSTAKKNGLAADYIINMGILEKYWKYGFSTTNIYNHTSRLALETFDETTTPPPPIRNLPARTLQDLLNPIPLAPNPAVATLFDNPDPYSHTALEEDEDDSDTQEGTVVMRSFDARRLAIEVLVNLEAPALVARLTPENATKPTAGTSTAHSTPAAPQKVKWTATSASWGKNDGGW
ncbi:hypothetical protein B0H10DRAFT_1964926 [Mycena sp. CBHHK59/15]|nr:hypothetical protein B0H10DRAFT_1964926 [Mycena sp. CBHHK59/15]